MAFIGGFFVGVVAQPLARLLAWLLVLLLVGVVIDVAILGSKTPPSRESSAQIVRAVDGDTLVVRQGGEESRVRVRGIDTPEVFGRRECGGEAASSAAKRWVQENPIVTLRSDPAAPDRDRYGRLLRYVEPPRFDLQPGEDLSSLQIRAGNATVAAYHQNLEKVAELRRFKRQAKRAGAGSGAPAGSRYGRATATPAGVSEEPCGGGFGCASEHPRAAVPRCDRPVRRARSSWVFCSVVAVTSPDGAPGGRRRS